MEDAQDKQTLGRITTVESIGRADLEQHLDLDRHQRGQIGSRQHKSTCTSQGTFYAGGAAIDLH